MTDYLERLFLPVPRNEEEGADIPSSPGVKVESEPVEFRTPAIPEGEHPQTLSPKLHEDVEIPRSRAVRAVEEFLSAPEEERSSVPLRRPLREREGEGLERRLRRDSRRFDSGFYWY